MTYSRVSQGIAVIVLLLPIALWPQADRNSELAGRQNQIDEARYSDRQKRHVDANGQWQMDKIVRDQYDQLTADTEKLSQLTAELKSELSNPNVLSAASVKKAEEIEKLAKKVRSRLKGWF
jgi:parvulin-like peptidyl-prolyl isomerase